MRTKSKGALLVLLVLAGGSAAFQEEEAPHRELRMGPFWNITETRPFRARERASIVVYGKAGNKTHMGVYVFDPHGNCVALDDLGSSSTKDDLAVVWFPPRTQSYTYEIRNLGMYVAGFEIAIR